MCGRLVWTVELNLFCLPLWSLLLSETEKQKFFSEASWMFRVRFRVSFWQSLVGCKLKFNSLTSASLRKTIKRARVNLPVSPTASVIRLVKDNVQNAPLLNLVSNPLAVSLFG